jgi:hypothetical protein
MMNSRGFLAACATICTVTVAALVVSVITYGIGPIAHGPWPWPDDQNGGNIVAHGPWPWPDDQNGGNLKHGPWPWPDDQNGGNVKHGPWPWPDDQNGGNRV